MDYIAPGGGTVDLETFTAVNEAAMLALDASEGDFCKRTDTATIWRLDTPDPTLIANWVEIGPYVAYTDSDARGAIGGVLAANGAATTNLDLDTHKIVNVTDPTADQDAATKKYVDDNTGSGGQTVYDVIVDSDGSGDYTDIATAFSTEGDGKSYLIRGSHVLNANITTPGSCSIHMDRVAFDVQTGGALSLEGKVLVNITGKATMTLASGRVISANAGRIFITDASTIGCDLSRFLLSVNAAGALDASGETSMIVLNGLRNHFGSFLIHNLTVGSIAGTGTLRLFNCVPSRSVTESIIIDTFTYNGAGASRVCGLASEGGSWHTLKSLIVKDFKSVNAIATNGLIAISDQNTYHVAIDSVTTDSGNNGVGALVFTGADYNSIIGTSRSCDGANFTDSGTGTAKAVAS